MFPVIGEFQLPDGSTATVRARRLTEDVPATAAAFAREVQAAVRRALTDVATDVQGLEVDLSYDETILRGHVGRVEIRATAARMGDLKRPGSLASSRRATSGSCIEDVLVNPFSVHATGGCLRSTPAEPRSSG